MYALGSEVFRTKTEVTKYCQKLKTIGSEYLPGSFEFDFLVALIRQGHPDAIERLATPVVCFSVVPDGWGSSCFNVRYCGGVEDTISYRICVRGLGKSIEEQQKAAIEHMLRRAMRQSIAHQIDDFRRSRKRCDACKRRSGRLEIHHKRESTFKDLCEYFLCICAPAPTNFDWHPDTPRCYFREQDIDFKRSWVQFHAAAARLEALCPRCHKQAHTTQ